MGKDALPGHGKINTEFVAIFEEGMVLRRDALMGTDATHMEIANQKAGTNFSD